jgi:nitrogen fixation NifU-like protein
MQPGTKDHGQSRTVLHHRSSLEPPAVERYKFWPKKWFEPPRTVIAIMPHSPSYLPRSRWNRRLSGANPILPPHFAGRKLFEISFTPALLHPAMPIDEEELYQEHILDHYEDPFHRGHLPTATHAHEENNPLCGDVVRIELQLDESGNIVDAFFDGQGCVISQASASMLLEAMQGKSIEDVKRFSAEDMLELYGARLTPNRQKCCLLSWKVLQSAVHSPADGAGGR